MKRSPNRELVHTTPFPNVLLDEVMPRLKDTPWRVLCVVVRQTLGWQSQDAGSRKERDWLTRSQLMARTGRNVEALSAAIDTLVRQGFIEVQDSEGRALSSALQRRAHRGRSYYALAEPWRQRIKQTTSPETRKSEQLLPSSSSIFSPQPRKSEQEKVEKANGTKERLTKEKPIKNHREVNQESNINNFSSEADIVAFITSFKAVAGQAGLPQPKIRLAEEELNRLKIWLTRYDGKSRLSLLEKYFASRLPYIQRHEYSLSAFLHTRHILPFHGNSAEPKESA
jgi:hypothetical protein